jgi:hypothetical protein
MTPDLAVPERRALYSLILGGTAAAVPQKQTAALLEKGLAKLNKDGELCATEEGREWLRSLLRRRRA